MFLAETRAQSEQLGMYSDLKDYYWDYENNQPDYSKW
jgi:endonuclease YncB( thermonuclease family)